VTDRLSCTGPISPRSTWRGATGVSFEEDRVRDDELLPAGIETTRITGPRLDREPGAVVESLRRHLARRAAS
jgi:hypothetical protein